MEKKQKIQLNTEDDLEVEYLYDGEEGTEKKISATPKKKGNPKKVMAVIMAVVSIFVMFSFAWWYYNSSRSVETENRKVMVPYYLYLLQENKTDYFQLQVVNMHPDETKRFIVCVSNKDKNDTDLSYTVGRESEFNYELEFAYTQNIPLDYSVYELAPVTLDENGNVKPEDQGKELYRSDTGNVWEKIKDSEGNVKNLVRDEDASLKETNNSNKEMYGETEVVNMGQYDVYALDANGKFMQLKTSYNGSESIYEYDYYLVEINWKDGVRNFGKYLKETDLVYVIVKAVQPKPEEKEDNN